MISSLFLRRVVFNLWILLASLKVSVFARKLTNQEGLNWLAQKGSEEGSITLPSGIVYKVLREGFEGTGTPSHTDQVELHFRARSIGGEEFDSSYSRGGLQPVVVNQHPLQGFREILPLMSKDAKWEVYMPCEMAYGRRGAGRLIKNGDALHFTIHLVNIMKKTHERRKEF